MTAPERIWAWEITERGIPQGAGGWIRHKASGYHEYILHTREALAQLPIVQAMIKDAVEQELDALLAERDAALAEVARLSHAHAALRAKLAEAETERNTLRSENSGLNHILWMMEADRDEERKLADDAVHELKHARAVLRHEQYLDDPGREAVIARHAARRKE